VTYTEAALGAVGATVALDLVVLRTRLLRRRLFWTTYAIVVFFQLVVNGVLTGRDVVTYDAASITGLRVAFAPVEDLLFGFALVTQTLCWWAWWGWPARTPSGGRAGRAAGPAPRRGPE